MASVACWLYEATRDKRFLEDALLVWNGDKTSPGVEKALYKGDGRWEGKPGVAAFGKQLPWEGAEYCSIGASLYRITGDERYKAVVIATAMRILSPAGGWATQFQVHESPQLRLCWADSTGETLRQRLAAKRFRGNDHLRSNDDAPSGCSCSSGR